MTEPDRPICSPARIVRAAGLAILLALAAAPYAKAQTFTKVTTGAVATDLGASRSAHWIDYDKDGDLDLFVTRGKAGGENNILYRNDGAPSFTFTPMTGLVVSQDGAPSDGATWGDYDNDGDDDLFVVNWYGIDNMMYRNEGDGTFTRILTGAPVTDGGYSETASWGDYDNDGLLDLAVSNSAGDLREFLYKNLGAGAFAKITSGAPVSGAGETRGVTWVDFDGDLDLDLFAVNEANQNEVLYRNMLAESGIDTFSVVSGDPLVSSAASTWSASWGDYNNDGDLDVFLANTGNQNNSLFDNQGGGVFSKMPTGFGDIVDDSGFSASSSWIDADNDGDLDLYVSNAYGAPVKNFFYRNLLTETGGAIFERELAGAFVSDIGYTYGIAWGDYDEDGDLDLYGARTLFESQTGVLYRNDGNANHWVTIDLKGTVSNASAIGARIRAKAVINGSPAWQLRVVEGQQGYCSQTLQQHIGLESATLIDSLVIDWPSGLQDVFVNVPADQRYSIAEQLTVIPQPSSPPHQAGSQLPTATLRWNKTLSGGPFHLQVSTDSTFSSGMIVDDSTVTDTSFTLDSLANTTSFYWRIQQSRSIRKDLWSAARSFVVGASTFDYGVIARWNLVSVPVTVANYRADALFPTSLTAAFSFEGGTAYAARETLSNGSGYWLKCPAEASLLVAGLARAPETLAVAAGWNLIGSRAARVPFDAVTSIPGGIISSPAYGYEGGYAAAESLAPFRGYWVRLSAPGLLVIGDSAAGARKGSARRATASATLEFRDALENSQRLFISAAEATAEEEFLSALPPVPPSGVFDVRFAAGASTAFARGGNADMLIEIRSAHYPLRIAWKGSPPPGAALVLDGRVVPPGADGGITLDEAVSAISLRYSNAPASMPTAVRLSQNYPNPFNPETSIEFDVPRLARGEGLDVTLRVYDLLGRLVATLVSARLEPGSYRASWNAAGAPDGVYYYRLRAGEESLTRRMLVMK